MLSKLLMAVFFSFVLAVVSADSRAESNLVPVEAMNNAYTINASMMDNLNALTGKRVTLFLDGGKVLRGRVKSVGAELVYLQNTEQNEVFNLLIRIQSIQALELRRP